MQAMTNLIKSLSLTKKILIIQLVCIILIPLTSIGIVKANGVRQAQQLLSVSKQLTKEGNYQQAINKLKEAESKWSLSGTKKEIEEALIENKILNQSTKNYELGKEAFDKSKFEDAIKLLGKVDRRNINYTASKDLINLAEREISKPKSSVAGVSTTPINTSPKKKVSTQSPVASPPPSRNPSPSLSPTPSVAIPILQPAPVIDPAKTAELRNILAEAGRLGAVSGNASVQLQLYLDLQSHCSRPTYADEAHTILLSPSESDSLYNSCLAPYQSNIDTQRKIIEDANSKKEDLKRRANILAAECPKCWEEAQK